MSTYITMKKEFVRYNNPQKSYIGITEDVVCNKLFKSKRFTVLIWSGLYLLENKEGTRKEIYESIIQRPGMRLSLKYFNAVINLAIENGYLEESKNKKEKP